MSKIYCMSDIHGFYGAFAGRLEQLGELRGEDKLILLGDYIDYGSESGQVLRRIYELQQALGDRCIVLRGNHEEMLLEWLDAYTGLQAGQVDEYGLRPWNPWLNTDPDFQTFHTLVTPEQWAFFRQVMPTLSEDSLNLTAVKMVLETNRDLIRWLRGLPYYHETEKQIFVHAGIDEEAGDWWRLGTPASTFVGKYPHIMGRFDKDIIAGHVGTYKLMGDPDFHGILWDGESHYFCDGTVSVSGNIPVLVYDTDTCKYYSLGGEGLRPVARCPENQAKKWKDSASEEWI